MKRIYALMIIALMLDSLHAVGQYASAVDYMSYLNNQETELAKDYFDYVRAVAHSNSARKMERRRKEVLATVNQALNNAQGLKAYNGDTTLRGSYVTYYAILRSVLNEDYGKIVDLEEIAEQSYDNMEAYLLAQEKAGEKLDEVSERREKAYENFAAQNKIRLVGTESKLSKKLAAGTRTSKYYHELFLIFFKANKQEYYLVNAFNEKNVNTIEQNRSTLAKYADEGVQKLDKVQPFDNDNTLIVACRKLMAFYKMEAVQKTPAIMQFLMKQKEFEKTKKAFEAKDDSDRTSEDVKAYNKMVDDLNKAATASNQVNSELNATRARLSDGWRDAVSRFLDVHTPR